MPNSKQQDTPHANSPWARWYALFVATLGLAATFAIWWGSCPDSFLISKGHDLNNTQVSILMQFLFY